MKNITLKPFSLELYRELRDSSSDFKVVNGKNEEVLLIDDNVTINGESGNVLYVLNRSYFTTDRNGKHAKDPTFCDLYIKTPPPYNEVNSKNGLDNMEDMKEIMDMVASGILYGVTIHMDRDSDGDITVKLSVLKEESKKAWTSFNINTRGGIENLKRTIN